jgi:hypothetical protein
MMPKTAMEAIVMMINEAYLVPDERNFSHFLYTFHFIKAYPTEAQRVGK